MQPATFAIVIPAHNGESFIGEALGSALHQSRKADELVVVDDGSTDNTAGVIQSGHFKGRFRYLLNETPTGFVDAWNRAIQHASGNFVTILHQDDLLHPDYLKHLEKAVLQFPKIKHFYTACNYIDANGAVIHTPPKPHSLKPVLFSGKEYARNYLNGVAANRHIHRCPGVTTQRRLLLDTCTYRKEAGHIADDDFFLRVGAFTDVVGISYPLASFRHHKSSETGKLDSLTLELAEAYLFQVRYYKNGSSILEPAEIEKINRLAVRFINLLLFQGQLHQRRDWIDGALRLRGQLDGMKHGFMEQTIPIWARPLWMWATGSHRHRHAATLYVRFLSRVRHIRDLAKSALKARS